MKAVPYEINKQTNKYHCQSYTKNKYLQKLE